MSDNYLTQTLYFKKPGPDNTESVLEHASKRAKELRIKKVVIASNSGRTIEKALKYFDPKEFTIINVTQVTGFSEPDQQVMDEETRSRLKSLGVKVLTAAHAFGGTGRGVRNKVGTFQVDEIMAFTLRMLGQGVKVGVEISYMAADRGYVRTDEEILTIGGTGRGSDTAMVVKPANSHRSLELKVKEIIAKPWNP
ncbi:MAG: hypothetical protein JRG97_00045 [Deltaproteobacteria bacterium]|nr:hypothetical protein [Deltaproteobacteria bacterium]MBW2139445.1 hypothetical protein [Deltaproteobacteria bacterium]